jgi:hypothetical protein
MKCKIVLDGTARISGFLVFARGEPGHNSPECGEDRNTGEDCKEYSRFQTAANLPRTIQWNEGEERKEEGIGEAFRSASIRREGSILD